MQTKILQYSIPSIKLTQNQLRKYMSDTLAFIENEKAFENTNILNLFHNQTNKYSSIQFAVVNGSLSMTAYGHQEIDALEKWWHIYQVKKEIDISNFQEIRENYKIHFLEKPQKYKISKLLVGRSVKELSQATNTKEDKKRMAKYIMANFLPFFNHLNYRHNREKQEITVKVNKIKAYNNKIKNFNKGSDLAGYDINFKTNLYLPNIIRIGQSTALGFGTITKK